MNVILGYGATAGAMLVAQIDVAKIAFTESFGGWQEIKRMAAKSLKEVTLKLSGSLHVFHDTAQPIPKPIIPRRKYTS